MKVVTFNAVNNCPPQQVAVKRTLGEEVGGAMSHCIHGKRFITIACEENNGNINGSSVNFIKRIHAIAVRQRQVAEDNVKHMRAQAVQPFRQIIGLHQRVSIRKSFLQENSYQADVGGVVFDDQDFNFIH